MLPPELSYTNSRTWAVYESLVRHMDDIDNDIILQLMGAFLVLRLSRL